ncbi:MAG: sialate O-acetylesterase, partial [Sphingobacteriales bacterium]
SLLYNAMINPITGLSIKGVIWYQGESNAGRAYEYRHTFPLLINDWRKQWQQGDFPFLFVQLTNFNWANGDSNKGSLWAELRESQTYALSLPKTGMAVTVDIGDANDLHPKDKQNVGKRLAAIALQNTYGQKPGYQYPSFQAVKINGSGAILTFKNTGRYLITPDRNGYVKGFEIAGADHIFHYATAFIDGNNVTVCSPKVDEPVAVRYAWADDVSDANVFNSDGYPLAPFRTDNWKGITETARYKLLQIF